MNSPYTRETEEVRERLFPFNPYYPNKVYKQNDGLYVYKNTKGYIHVLKPCKIKYDGEYSHYEITDSMLTKDGIVKEVSCGGFYKTREDCIAKIEEDTIKE